MADIKAIKDLVVCSFYGRTPDPTKYSVEDIKKTASEELKAIANDYYSFQKNKYDIFQIYQEAWTEVLPKEVEQFMGSFADIKHVGLNEKAQFRVDTGRRRAKQFITEVGLSGVYESFRLDKNTFEVGGRAIGGAGYIDFERYLCGDEDITETLEILLEGLTEAVYGEIQKALLAAVNAEDRPANNRYVTAGFDADLMAKACSVAGTYGNGVVIYATPEFVAEMGPDAIGMPVYGTYALPANPTAGSAPGYATPVYNPRNIEEIAQYGRIKTFRGNPIVEMPQSYTDETNEVYVTNPAVAYIFPSGKEKPVKIVFEGDTMINEWGASEGQRDRNMEVEVYQRVGVAILTNYDWCVYVNTDLQDQTKYPTKYPTDFH
jgi:hypothetical protein